MAKYIKFSEDFIYIVKVYGDDIYEYEFGDIDSAKALYNDVVKNLSNKNSIAYADIYGVKLIKYSFGGNKQLLDYAEI